MKIKITGAEIKDGVRYNEDFCPIALAVTKMGHKCWVGKQLLFLNGRRHEMPPQAINFIHRFDNNLYVEPFEFDLPVDDAILTNTK